VLASAWLSGKTFRSRNIITSSTNENMGSNLVKFQKKKALKQELKKKKKY
jgi:hypothetical protein